MSNNLPQYLTISTEISDDLVSAIERIGPDKYAILVDENTRKYCLPKLRLTDAVVIEIKSGEINKTLETCKHIWDRLTFNGFTRKSLLINLGGGVIGDMGGFCAATYKRGIPFINIPTTLLSQVDASIGGKLGVDFNGLKNHIGLFQEPNEVIINTKFLETLSQRELKSGFAEIIKHSLIGSKKQWDYIKSLPFEKISFDKLIPESIAIKNSIVEKDPNENNIRKTLNYGHTVGHAIESCFLDSENHLLHGEAIAIGMILENEIALKLGMLEAEEAEAIEKYTQGIYGTIDKFPSYDELKSHLMQDKKNDAGGIRFSLLSKIESCTYDVLVDESILKEVLK